MIRVAHLKDIDSLVVIENLSFETDRFTRRSFRYLLTKANALMLVDETKGVIRGYVNLLLHTGTSLARLYSIAVHPKFLGKGVGKTLLEAAEDLALQKDCAYMRLEVRSDNLIAQNLYLKAGYKKFGVIADYYEDSMEATRFEKFLASGQKPDIPTMTYYQQTLDFTCGPSSLMMAMHALDRNFVMDRKTELRIWREATTIFMTSGHGGCSPHGLALSAFHRGFGVILYIKEDPLEFMTGTVRSAEKKEVMKLVQADFMEEVRKSPIKVKARNLTLHEMEEHVVNGRIPIILVSTYRMHREKYPHWIVVTGFDEKYVFCHDPYVAQHNDKTSLESINMPVLKKDFEKMTRFGKTGQKAAIIIYKG